MKQFDNVKLQLRGFSLLVCKKLSFSVHIARFSDLAYRMLWVSMNGSDAATNPNEGSIFSA